MGRVRRGRGAPGCACTPGTPDLAFSPTGLVTYGPSFDSGGPTSLVPLADGSVVATRSSIQPLTRIGAAGAVTLRGAPVSPTDCRTASRGRRRDPDPLRLQPPRPPSGPLVWQLAVTAAGVLDPAFGGDGIVDVPGPRAFDAVPLAGGGYLGVGWSTTRPPNLSSAPLLVALAYSAAAPSSGTRHRSPGPHPAPPPSAGGASRSGSRRRAPASRCSSGAQRRRRIISVTSPASASQRLRRPARRSAARWSDRREPVGNDEVTASTSSATVAPCRWGARASSTSSCSPPGPPPGCACATRRLPTRRSAPVASRPAHVRRRAVPSRLARGDARRRTSSSPVLFPSRPPSWRATTPPPVRSTRPSGTTRSRPWPSPTSRRPRRAPARRSSTWRSRREHRPASHRWNQGG